MAHLRHAGILFHRFMLQELRECVLNLSAESFAIIKSWAEPPALVQEVVKAVLLLLHPDWKGSEEIESWSQYKLVRIQIVESLFSILPPPRRRSKICQGGNGSEIINCPQISYMVLIYLLFCKLFTNTLIFLFSALQKLDDNLIQEIYCFDPTASSVQVQAELLLNLITGKYHKLIGRLPGMVQQ